MVAVGVTEHKISVGISKLSLPVHLRCSRFLNKSEKEPDIHKECRLSDSNIRSAIYLLKYLMTMVLFPKLYTRKLMLLLNVTRR